MMPINRTTITGLCMAAVFGLGGLLPAHAERSHGPEIEHWTTDSGLGVYLVRTDALPIVDLSLLFDAGSARDGDLPGLASMTSSLLREGADGLDAGALARRFEDQGARFSTSSGRDTATLTLRSLSDEEPLEAAIDTLARVMAKPDFPESALERQRRRMQVALNNARNDPGSIASRRFWKELYGDHPYANPPGGTEESLAEIGLDDVRGFHERYYVAGNATLALVGDVSRERAEQIAERLDDAIPAGERAPALPDPDMPEEGKVIHIPFQAAQSRILMGHPGYARGDDDHFTLYVGNHILGGSGLVSRLADEMREQRGLSYSVSSRFSPMQAAGPFIMSTSVRTDRTGEAREVLGRQLQDMRATPPEDNELRDAIRNITGSFPLSLDSNRKIAGFVANIGFHGLPLDYLDTFPARVEAVTAESIQERFRERLDPERMITVIVGPEDEDGND